MTEEAVRKKARDFVNALKLLTEQFPLITLNGTWPSIGVIDLMARKLREKTELTPGEDKLLQDIAAYVSVFICDCWRGFGDGQSVSLKLIDDARGEIVLTAKEGLLLGGNESFSISVTSILRRILRENGRSIRIFSDFSCTLPPFRNLLSLVTLGLCLGPTPYGYGPWADLTINELDPFLARALPFLVASSAEHYSQRFPGEMIGQELPLYLQGLIFPPLGFRETSPALRGARGLIAYRETLESDMKKTSHFLKNLVYSPDELISLSAFCTCVSLNLHPDVTKLWQENKLGFLPELRDTIITLKKETGLALDWLDELHSGRITSALKHASAEQEQGLIPLLDLPISLFISQENVQFLTLLTQGKISEAIAESDELVDKNSSPELHLCRAFLELKRGGFSRAEAELKAVAALDFSAEPLRLDYLYYLALLHLERGEWEASYSFLRQASTLLDPGSQRTSQVFLLLARIELANQRYLDAFNSASRAVENSKFSLESQLTLVDCLEQSGNHLAAKERLKRIAAFSATDPLVFSRIFA